MLYLWIKALHVVFVVAWFAGLFYLPRLFVYHTAAMDAPGDTRFKLMERRLFALMTIAGTAATAFGVTLLVLQPAWLQQGWLDAKLALVMALVLYHIWCGRLVFQFREGRNVHSERWYRWFNDAPTLLLFTIVVLAVVKPA
jgi:putative membrane protein